ncbi:hypothetical protein ANO14919_028240 [Xylariales sp. No.14919]|nr:hypothetical protein ANO14919_028240 [Xylariales sp. No.14919]
MVSTTLDPTHDIIAANYAVAENNYSTLIATDPMGPESFDMRR